MKTRQFKRLAGLPLAKRVPLVVEGLAAIGANVTNLAIDLEQCNEAKAYRAARLLHNVAREEAGKFLVLIDAYRAPAADQATLSRQFSRAGDHLSKLLYAQMADYSIGSRKELHSAVTRQPGALPRRPERLRLDFSERPSVGAGKRSLRRPGGFGG